MSHQRSMRVDVTNKEVKGLELEQKVTIIVKGTIKELEAERTSEFPVEIGSKKGKPEVFPPSISIEISSTTVKTKNVFAELSEADDDD